MMMFLHIMCLFGFVVGACSMSPSVIPDIFFSAQEVYSGMVIGEHARAGDLEVNNAPQSDLSWPFPRLGSGPRRSIIAKLICASIFNESPLRSLACGNICCQPRVGGKHMSWCSVKTASAAPPLLCCLTLLLTASDNVFNTTSIAACVEGMLLPFIR